MVLFVHFSVSLLAGLTCFLTSVPIKLLYDLDRDPTSFQKQYVTFFCVIMSLSLYDDSFSRFVKDDFSLVSFDIKIFKQFAHNYFCKISVVLLFLLTCHLVYVLGSGK